MAIGPAGEHRVRFACLAHYWKNREGVAGRGGIGAVLGAKHVKAVVVRGSRKTERRRPGRLKQLLDETPRAPEDGHREPLDVRHAVPRRAHQRPRRARRLQPQAGDLRRGEAIGGRSLKAHYHDRDTTCLKCPVACGKQYEIRDGESRRRPGEDARVRDHLRLRLHARQRARPELVQANDLCDLLGLDTITMGVTLAFVAEASSGAPHAGATSAGPFGWGDWRGHAAAGRDDRAPRGIRRPPGRGRVAAGRRSGPRPSACPTRSSGSSCPPTRRAR